MQRIKEGEVIPIGLSYCKAGNPNLYNPIIRFNCTAIYYHRRLWGSKHLMLKLYVIGYVDKPWYLTRIVPGYAYWDGSKAQYM